ncbi:hypothetical protein GMA12_16905 [Kocuria sediminis]|uniref:DUF2267 domain-containing protein n=1 Tax=Kocuria sediminis TaxID=1038857 RepID=A0A6N8GPG6_9MICC|nr:hypothetical protein [Kocuria sediminis]
MSDVQGSDQRLGSRAVTIGVMADPGLPEKVAGVVAEDLERDLAEHIDARVQWRVESDRGTLPLTAEGDIPLLDQAPRIREERGWDYLIYLTDLPRTHGGEPMVCELSSTTRATLVSLPTLGCWRVTARTRRLLVTLIDSVQHGSEDYPSQPAARQAVGHGAIRRQSSAGEDTAYVTVPGSWNRLRLLAGMVRHNRPHRLLSALSSCVAAAAATGAFGIFYTSIWSMADALHPGRLALISVVVIAALSSWLILHNGLWTTTGSSVRNTFAGRQAAWDNAATVITVGLSVALMYAILYLVLLISAVAVIDTGYLHSQLGHPVGPADYARLSWLAASLGTMAGALGSNFDSDHAIREATYSRRAHQRRQLAQAQDG